MLAKKKPDSVVLAPEKQYAVVLLNEEDMTALGLQAGQLVDLRSHCEGETRTARHFKVVPFAIPRRCAATYFPEANVLVPLQAMAEKSRTPASKSIAISVTTVS